MKFKNYMSKNTNGNASHWVGLLKRISVLKCPPVRKLPDAFVAYHVPSAISWKVFYLRFWHYRIKNHNGIEMFGEMYLRY